MDPKRFFKNTTHAGYTGQFMIFFDDKKQLNFVKNNNFFCRAKLQKLQFLTKTILPFFMTPLSVNNSSRTLLGSFTDYMNNWRSD